jgi:hypothetical protein
MIYYKNDEKEKYQSYEAHTFIADGSTMYIINTSTFSNGQYMLQMLT